MIIRPKDHMACCATMRIQVQEESPSYYIGQGGALYPKDQYRLVHEDGHWKDVTDHLTMMRMHDGERWGMDVNGVTFLPIMMLSDQFRVVKINFSDHGIIRTAFIVQQKVT